jgi:hypothetical protein
MSNEKVRSYILKRVAKPCSPTMMRNIPSLATFDLSQLEAELKRMRAAGEVYFTSGKWWRPAR